MGSSRVGSNPTRSVTLQWEAISLPNHNLNLSLLSSLAAMAEWLRRLTRNQMGSSRVGSNPTRSVDASCIPSFFWIQFHCKIDHDGDRTHNLPIRSRTPYPLGHAAGAPFSIFLIDIWLMQFCTTMNAKVVLVVPFVSLSFLKCILTQDVYCVHIVYRIYTIGYIYVKRFWNHDQ